MKQYAAIKQMSIFIVWVWAHRVKVSSPTTCRWCLASCAEYFWLMHLKRLSDFSQWMRARSGSRILYTHSPTRSGARKKLLSIDKCYWVSECIWRYTCSGARERNFSTASKLKILIKTLFLDGTPVRKRNEEEEGEWMIETNEMKDYDEWN